MSGTSGSTQASGGTPNRPRLDNRNTGLLHDHYTDLVSIPQFDGPAHHGGPRRALAPEESHKEGFGSKSWHVNLVWTGCVVVVLALVAAFGGFSHRPNTRIIVNPGTTVSLGVADVQVMSATARSSSISVNAWTISVQATLHVSAQDVSTSSFGNALLLGYTNGTGAQLTTSNAYVSVMDLDDPTRVSPRATILPSDQAVPVQFTFTVTDGLTVSKGILVGLFPVVYTTQVDTMTQIPSGNWVSDTSAGKFWVVQVPVQQD